MKITKVDRRVDDNTFEPIAIITMEMPISVTTPDLSEEELALYAGRMFVKAMEEWRRKNS